MAAPTFFCASPTAVFAFPTVSSIFPSAFNLSLPVRSPTACLTLRLARSIFPSRSFLFHMTCSIRCWRSDLHRNSMRQTASERLFTSEHPKSPPDRVDELGPNHCQRTEISVIARGKPVYTGATPDLGDNLDT